MREECSTNPTHSTGSVWPLKYSRVMAALGTAAFSPTLGALASTPAAAPRCRSYPRRPELAAALLPAAAAARAATGAAIPPATVAPAAAALATAALMRASSSSDTSGFGRKSGAECTTRSAPGRLSLTTAPPPKQSTTDGCVPKSVNDGWNAPATGMNVLKSLTPAKSAKPSKSSPAFSAAPIGLFVSAVCGCAEAAVEGLREAFSPRAFLFWPSC
eukprot:1151867-Pleurochrysis_carterae.AAC.2